MANEREAKIWRIIFHSPSNDYYIVSMYNNDGKTFTAKGIMPGIREGMNVAIEGTWSKDSRGLYFKVDSCTEKRPTDKKGIYAYLSSGLIKNIGPEFAKKLVDTYGEKTFDVIDNHPEYLTDIKGIGQKRAEALVSALKEQKDIRDIMLWLKRYDISNSLATKIYKAYGSDSVSLLQQNPYRLNAEIQGVGFRKADSVALNIGFSHDNTFRVTAGIGACLEDLASLGHTCYPLDQLVTKVSSDDYLGIDPSTVRNVIGTSDFVKTGIVEKGYIYLREYYFAEKHVAEHISRIKESGEQSDTNVNFNMMQKTSGIYLSDEQKDAVLQAVNNPVMILTGGPGTGKTTTTKAIINELRHEKKRFLLAAPTGRAAKRMTEATGWQAQTIHRLLEFSQGGFMRDEYNPLDADAVIVDEASMMDTHLANSLLRAIKDGTRLIMVGDDDQLPSIGAGNVLKDLIQSREIPTVHLNKVFRQARESDIIMNAHRINHAMMPVTDNSKDYLYFRHDTPDAIADAVVETVRKKILVQKSCDIDSLQVLCPMRREWDPIGSTRLNARLQEALNANSKTITKKGEVEFKVGDRVMQIRNNYDKGVFNGDVGIITCELPQSEEQKSIMRITFPDKTVDYAREDVQELELAYACTIHKSQGSEYSTVIIPLHESQTIMLNRNLLYTAVTRAKRECVVIGTDTAVRRAVTTANSDKRYTHLAERIKTECSQQDKKAEKKKSEGIKQ